MSGNVIQGPFYNSGFYDTGAGGGDTDIVTVEGIDYSFVRVGKYYVTNENLRNEFSSLELNGNVNSASYRWVNNNKDSAIANKYNIGYSVSCMDIIDALLPDGWRCVDKTQWDYMCQNFGSLEKFCSWNNNEMGLSLVRNGNGMDSGTFIGVGSVANMLSRITLCSVDTSGNYTSSGTTTDRFAAIRLYKDVS